VPGVAGDSGVPGVEGVSGAAGKRSARRGSKRSQEQGQATEFGTGESGEYPIPRTAKRADIRYTYRPLNIEWR
jgi:hypothetical protein